MKKTRAEKRLADARRGMEFERTNQVIAYKANITDSVEIKTNSEPKKEQVVSQIQSLYIYPVQLIRKDLTKTFVLCILAISLELGLYIILEKPGLLPF